MILQQQRKTVGRFNLTIRLIANTDRVGFAQDFEVAIFFKNDKILTQKANTLEEALKAYNEDLEVFLKMGNEGCIINSKKFYIMNQVYILSLEATYLEAFEEFAYIVYCDRITTQEPICMFEYDESETLGVAYDLFNDKANTLAQMEKQWEIL